ncbi:hypothetical protein ACFXKH_38325 [Streptomyces caelestis]|uniref:hypothetical protein n=1 Tax=Streptomyces caelestis TaxID=36816 RepID=UPI0036CB3A5C
MTGGLRLCNKGVDAPWKAIARAHQREDAPYLYSELFCELAAQHDGDHADFKTYVGYGIDVWVCWTDNGHFAYVIATPCGAEDPDEDPIDQAACSLFADHPPGHSWEFADLLHG